MGLLSANVFESSVAFSGVRDYATSGDEDRPIVAHVAFSELASLDLGAPPLALLIPLAGARLLGLLRREPRYVEPVATVLSLAGTALLPNDCDAANFRMRDVVATDSETLGTFLNAGLDLSVAEVNSSIPVVEPESDRPVERRTRIRLLARRSNRRARVDFKFPMRSANPLVTASALFATIERAARRECFRDVTQPAAAGLVMLARMSERLSGHAGFDLADEAQACDLLTRMLVDAEPVGIAIAALEPEESSSEAPFRSKPSDSTPSDTPFGSALHEVHAETERLVASADGLTDPQRCVLLAACVGSAVAVGGYGSEQIRRRRDSDEYLPTNTGELAPVRPVQFAKVLDQEEITARVGAAGRAYRTMAWALTADMAVFFWRPNYDLEIAECAEVFGFSNTYETTIANIGRPGDDESEQAEADRRYELVKGALVCMIAAALDEEIDPEDPLVLLGIDVWIPYFGAGLEAASERIEALAPGGLPIWKATGETDP